MADFVALETSQREGRGSRKADRLRTQGKVPAVVYGHKKATESVSVDRDALLHAVTHKARVVDLKSAAGTQKALISELQWDHLGKDILHADFQRVAIDERISVSVPLELKGTAPGVTAGGALEQPLHSLQVECLAIAVPESVRVNIGELQIGSVIHVRDLLLPEGVKSLADPDAVVVQVKAPLVEAEAPAAVPAEGEQAEPEVIGRKVAAEEEGEEEKKEKEKK
jgi:large subunit ribosomal protein L25